MVRNLGIRKPTFVGNEDCAKENVNQVLTLLQKKQSLTKKQAEYCNDDYIARILMSRGNNVKKVAKQLKATLVWRGNLDVDHLTADEFSPELALGTAYVAGSDHGNRPVVIVRLKPEHHASQSKKRFFRFIVFTMEVAIATMPFSSEQCVIILDAGYMEKGSQGLTTVIQIMKMLSEHYPERLARAFIVDAPPVFYYLWKGLGSFIDLGSRMRLMFVFSKNYINPASPEAVAAAERNLVDAEEISSSNENIWTRAGNGKFIIDSISQSKGASLLIDKQQARSLSFASPATASCYIHDPGAKEFRSFRMDTVVRQLERKTAPNIWGDFSAMGNSSTEVFHHQTGCKQKERSIDIFRKYLGLYASPYNEASYRAIMKPPLGGLVAIVSLELRKQRNFTSGIAALEDARILDT